MYQELISFIDNEFYEKKNHNRHLIGFLIDAKIEMILEYCESSEIVHTQRVFQLCNLMAEKHDTLRRNYWKFVYKQFLFDKIKLRHASNDTGGGAKTDDTWRHKIGKKVDEESDDTLVPAEAQSNKKKTKSTLKEKKANMEKANGFGTDLLFEIMNKYNHWVIQMKSSTLHLTILLL